MNGWERTGKDQAALREVCKGTDVSNHIDGVLLESARADARTVGRMWTLIMIYKYSDEKLRDPQIELHLATRLMDAENSLGMFDELTGCRYYDEMCEIIETVSRETALEVIGVDLKEVASGESDALSICVSDAPFKTVSDHKREDYKPREKTRTQNDRIGDFGVGIVWGYSHVMTLIKGGATSEQIKNTLIRSRNDYIENNRKSGYDVEKRLKDIHGKEKSFYGDKWED